MTTRSTVSIALGASCPTPTPTATTSVPNQPTPTKRKRSQNDLPPTSSSSTTSWLGIAFQLPSVIKKEFNDFFKTVRGGSNHPTVASNASIHHLDHPTLTRPKAASERTKRIVSRRLSRSVPASDYLVQTRNTRSVGRSAPSRRRADYPPQISLPEFSDLDLPSPSKRLRTASERTSDMSNNPPQRPITNDPSCTQALSGQQSQHRPSPSVSQSAGPIELTSHQPQSDPTGKLACA